MPNIAGTTTTIRGTATEISDSCGGGVDCGTCGGSAVRGFSHVIAGLPAESINLLSNGNRERWLGLDQANGTHVFSANPGSCVIPAERLFLGTFEVVKETPDGGGGWIETSRAPHGIYIFYRGRLLVGPVSGAPAAVNLTAASGPDPRFDFSGPDPFAFCFTNSIASTACAATATLAGTSWGSCNWSNLYGATIESEFAY